MVDPTHRCLERHIRSTSLSDGPGRTTFEAGDEIAPYDSELRCYPGRFEPLDSDSEPEPESEPESGSEEPDESASSPGFDPDEWTPADLEQLSRSELRQLASHFDDVNGNAATVDLVAALAEKVGGDVDGDGGGS